MSGSAYFVQGCPTCGRRLVVKVEYLGKELVCRHCQGRLVAIDPETARCEAAAAINPLLQRANDLLDSVIRNKGQSSDPQPR